MRVATLPRPPHHPRGDRRARASHAALWAASIALLAPTLAAAQGRPLGRDPRLEWEGPIDYAATAASLLDCTPGTCAGSGENCRGLSEATVTFDVIPDSPTLRVVYAQLTWFATTPAAARPDPQVTLVPPGGAPTPVDLDEGMSEGFVDGLVPQECQLITLICPSVQACDLHFYSAHADVTDLLTAHREGGGSLNGQWTVRDVDIPGANDRDPQMAVAAIGSIAVGGWSLFVIYEDDALPLRRIYYYQGFELNSGVNRTVRARGFRAPPNAEVELTYLVLEGDEGTQGDSLTVNGVEVFDDCNPARNVFNSTVNAGRADGQCIRGVHGVDLDTYNLRDVVEAGDTEAEITFVVPAGDRVITAGEQIFTNWLLIAFDHIPPDFRSLKPEKIAEPPSRAEVRPGQRIDYLIVVENSGGDFASNVTVTDAIPAGTRYLPGSTAVDRRPVVDRGGTSPLVAGLNLADLPDIDTVAPGARHLITFSVHVADDARDGDEIRNVAQIAADSVEPLVTEPVFHTVSSEAPIPPDGRVPMPSTDAAVPPDPIDAGPRPIEDQGPRPDQGGCRADETRASDGTCVPLICREGEVVRDGRCQPNVDATADPCGPGTALIDGQCQSICGPGLRWDPTCEGGGQCRHEGQPLCNPGEDSASDGCGCTLERQSPRHALPLALLLLGLAFRAPRRRRPR